MTNEQVMKTWISGGKAKGGSLRADEDGKLYSYSLVIGERSLSGTTIFDHTISGGSFYSQTTSKHVSMAIRLAPWADVKRYK